MIRSFFALPLSRACEQALWQKSQSLQQLPSTRFLRWIAPENYHLTLAFLGDIQATECDRLETVAAAVALNHQATTLHLSHVEWFPHAAKPRMLVAVPKPTLALDKLQGDLQQQLRSRGFRVEKRKFRPHVSLARASKAFRACDLGDEGLSIEWMMDSLVLFRSELRPQGASYTALFEQPLIEQSQSSGNTVRPMTQ